MKLFTILYVDFAPTEKKGIDSMEKIIDSNIDTKLMSEQQAITHLKQGNIMGMSILVQNYQVKAVHAALLITRDRDLAEDVVQDAYLQTYRKIAQFDDSRPFGPWFLRIVINAAIKEVQKQKKSLPLEAPEGGNIIGEWLIDPSKSPEKLAESAENRELIWQAMERLTPNQRAAVVLRYFLEKNEREMIQELSRPLSTIKWWLRAARQRLQQLLQPIDKLEPDQKEINHD